MPEQNADAGLGELLESHGYLEHGVERFLGRPGSSGPRQVSATAMRLGLLAGPVTALVLLALRRLADADVFARTAQGVALSVFVWFAATALATGGGFVFLAAARSSARRARLRSAFAVAMIFAMSSAAGWWVLRRAVAADERGFDDVIAGALIVGQALVLWRLHALAGRAAVGRVGVWPTRLAPGFLALGVVLAVLQIAVAEGTAAEAAPDFDVDQTGIRVAWITLDGLTPDLADRGMESGKMPRLKSFLDGDDTFTLPLVVSAVSRTPAAIWTTAATGAPVAEHGVRAASHERIEARERFSVAFFVGALFPWTLETETRPYSVFDRRLPTLDEVVAAKKYRALSVNVWGSGPLATSETSEQRTVATDYALRRELVEPASSETSDFTPPEFAAFARRRLDALPAEFDARLAAWDDAVADLATWKAAKEFDLIAVTLTGLDLAAMKKTSSPPAAVDETSPTAALSRLDEAFGVLISQLGARGFSIVVTGASGRESGEARGFAALSGDPFRRALGATLALEEVAPLILRTLGFPLIDERTDGRLERLLDDDFRARHPVRTVTRYRERGRMTSRERESAEAQLEALRTLGYVGSGR